ncbi:ArsR/SmtB family transcription factor [Algoriphagus persicinus]|uniref:ArsR/SmtB family transcription factor n=1 Tax=Algoriphagus persicinus TaxID=3108754 RepID=UPI002B38D8C3|nr:metalloregulator ArsR/SmtB family transcription factor [Algoriphagus sp. E1-3-M2]MEB2785020.1 metalloregulator ArsR/SmtB family transcription factor [Algoriphagus sp. E1-3-M2]
MAEIARRDVFQAMADPTRRKIIELIAQGPMNVVTIASCLEMTQPAISQQIKILSECGIVTMEKLGRERHCRIKAENLIPAYLWLEQFQQQWTERIDSFEKYVNELQSKNKNQLKPKK